MHLAAGLVGLALLVTIIAGVAERYKISAPLLLVLAGIAVSFIPRIPTVEPR
jgi:ABC-type Fe3+-siderophore transport system permease subunit